MPSDWSSAWTGLTRGPRRRPPERSTSTFPVSRSTSTSAAPAAWCQCTAPIPWPVSGSRPPFGPGACRSQAGCRARRAHHLGEGERLVRAPRHGDAVRDDLRSSTEASSSRAARSTSCSRSSVDRLAIGAAHRLRRAAGARLLVVGGDVGVGRNRATRSTGTRRVGGDRASAVWSALAHLDRAGEHVERSVVVELGGGRRGRRGDRALDDAGEARARTLRPSGAAARRSPSRARRRRPGAPRSGSRPGPRRSRTGRRREQVPHPELDGIHPRRSAIMSSWRLVGPGGLADAVAAERAGRRQVGVDRVRVDPDVGMSVGARSP